MSPDFYATAQSIRRTILTMAHLSKSPHVGSCLSPVDIMTVLYFDIMRLDPWNQRDIFILSKGHAAMALYATLAERGILPRQSLAGYYQDNGTLPAHLDRFSAKGVEVSAGSLGHGFNMGLGLAYGLKNSGRRVYSVIGDGESQEGSIWEGALFAPKLGLSNFTAIIDCNNLQGYGRATELCAYEPIVDKWRDFGWDAVEVDGHDHAALRTVFDTPSDGRPRVIVARTIKGKGVSFMEDQLVWHYFLVTDDHLRQAWEELT